MRATSTDAAIPEALRSTPAQKDQLRQSPKERTDVINSINQSGISASEIEQIEHTFRLVGKAFIQAAGYDSEFRAEIIERRQEWTEIHNTYSDLLVDSCNEAGKARSVIEIFLPLLQSILKSKDWNLQQKRDRLEAFKQNATAAHGKATEFRKKFVNLKTRITEVQTRVESIIDRSQSQDQKKKKAKVTQRESRPGNPKTATKEMMAVMLGTGSLYSLLCPPIFAAWLAEVCTMATVALDVIAGVGYRAIAHDIEEKLNKAQDAITNMDVVTDALNPLPHSMDFISDRLSAFEGAWAAILKDINTIETNFDYADIVGWEKTSETTDPVCKVLIEAFKRYEALVIR